MKRYRDVTVSSSALNADELARYVESFAQLSEDWEFPAAKSLEYEQMCGGPSCCVVVANDILPRAAVHLTEQRSHALTVTNIVPLVLNELTFDQYNAIASAFSRDLRARVKADGRDIRVFMSKAIVCLDDIITGEICRKLFRQYLGAFPLSHHSLDIHRLDRFICSMSRFARKPFDLDAFQYLLAEELGWSSGEAKWCRDRVEIGLEVLTVYKRF